VKVAGAFDDATGYKVSHLYSLSSSTPASHEIRANGFPRQADGRISLANSVKTAIWQSFKVEEKSVFEV
jgi:hypothetical protein